MNDNIATSLSHSAEGSPELTSKARDPATSSPSLLSIRSEASTPRQGTRKVATPVTKRSILKGSSSDIPRPLIPLQETHFPHLQKKTLPIPKNPSRCPLFCCFYAEFDIKVGPKVSYQAPRNFMNQEIQLPVEKVHEILGEFFVRFQKSPPSLTPSSSAALSSALVPPEDNHTSHRRMESGNSYTSDFFHSLASLTREEDTFEPFSTREGSSSIFDSCSEYVITGSELTGKIVNLSTHSIHILTRPTIIANQRYERNSHSFCLGFVLRRTEDPRPFKPVLCKLADTIRDMEMESQFLSAVKENHTVLQSLLEWTLVSLNSSTWECNLYVNPANLLNLKLFHPPRRPPQPVPDHAVPIFLRRDWQLQNYEWDLAINWVSMHIDGVTSARQISQKAEVDMEMVQACLRVLLHHRVIALVDMFFYSNRYESTEKAGSMLSGLENKLLQNAVDFVIRRPPMQTQSEASPISGSPISGSRFLDTPTGRCEVANPQSFLAHSGSFRVTSSVSQGSYSDHGHSMSSQRRSEHHEVKHAIAELYAACHRGCSIGDLLVSLAVGNLPQGMPTGVVNWKRIFHLIDHRRFVSFGVVHGLLHRVHDYPFLVDGPSELGFDEGDSFGRSMLHGGSSAASSAHDRPYRPFLKTEPSRDEEWKLKQEVATFMDGRHSDDELVCKFEKSFEELIELFGEDQIMHIYAPDSSV